MVEMGYYNYYNNEYSLSVEEPEDRYKKMIDRYNANSNSLHSMNEDPYSEKNIAIREFEEKLAVIADENRSQCSTVHDVYALLSEKYFGENSSTDISNIDEQTLAMYYNELNATLYGTYQNSNLNDPRINWQEEDWDIQLLKDKKSNQKIISQQMNNLLTNNNIILDPDDILIITFDPYTYFTTIEGLNNTNNLSKVNKLLKENENGKELFYYTLQNSANLNKNAMTKYNAYQNIKNLTGEDLSELTLKDGIFYTDKKRNILSLVEEGIDKDFLIPKDFKDVAYNYIKGLLKEIAKFDYNSIPDLHLSISYSTKDGFFITNNIIPVA